MSVCLFVCVFVRHSFSLRLTVFFAPTSRNPMSKLFRFSESLGKSNGNKWSQICKLLLIKGKICRAVNFAFLAGFFGIGATICIGREILCLPYAGFFVKNFELP